MKFGYKCVVKSQFFFPRKGSEVEGVATRGERVNMWRDYSLRVSREEFRKKKVTDFSGLGQELPSINNLLRKKGFCNHHKPEVHHSSSLPELLC